LAVTQQSHRAHRAASDPRRAIVAWSLVGGIASALLIPSTVFLSAFLGPLFAGCIGALYIERTHPREARRVSTSGLLIVLGSVAIMIGTIVVSDIAYAIFG
jgi:hypothetical protein